MLPIYRFALGDFASKANCVLSATIIFFRERNHPDFTNLAMIAYRMLAETKIY